MTTIEFSRVIRTSIAAPVQWDAYDNEGRYYYLRHRHARGRIESSYDECNVHFDGDLPELATANEQLLAAFLDLANQAGDTRWTLRDDCDIVPYDFDQEQRQMDAAYAQLDRAPAAPAPIPAPAPQPLFKGRVAIFMAPDQSLVISYRRDGHDGQKQTVIPGMYLAMAASTVGANPEQLLAKMLEL